MAVTYWRSLVQIKERHVTLQNVTAPVAEAQNNKVNHPHTPITSKAKIVNVISTESKISTKIAPTHKEVRGVGVGIKEAHTL